MSLVKFDVTRNSPKWTLNSSGNLQSGSDNLPGFEFNADGSYKGVLVEPESTNLFSRSQELNSWSKRDSVVISDVEISPDGTQNADKIIVNNGTFGSSGTNSELTTGVYKQLSYTTGETYTFSAFVKDAGAGYVKLHGASGARDFHISFNFSNKQFLKGNHPEFSVYNLKYKEYKDGWYKISYTFTFNLNGTVYLSLASSLDSFSNETYDRKSSGNGVDGIYGYGLQLEASPIATSYINTTSSTVTRNEDVITLTSASQYLPSEGKITLGWEQKENDTIYIGALSAENKNVFVGALTASIGPGSRELVYEYSNTELKLSIDGTLVSSLTGSFDISNMNEIQLGHNNEEDQPNTHLKYFAVE